MAVTETITHLFPVKISSENLPLLFPGLKKVRNGKGVVYFHYFKEFNHLLKKECSVVAIYLFGT